jgi:ArsR family transcriptional regulator, arsenate/arsenite/antimonite-responsive transcriptional repressor
MRSIVRAAHALSDETRVRMLSLLIERECCVCEVMQTLRISQTRASRNLAILHDAGFLESRRDGLWTYYSIDRSNLEQYLALLLDAVAVSLVGNKVAESDREHLRAAERLGPQCCGPSKAPAAQTASVGSGASTTA